MGRLVAIKVLTESSKDVLTRFRNEAIVAGNLRHENVVTVYEYGEFQGSPFLVMEYLEGEDLHEIISSRKPLTLLEKCNILSQVAEGLYCAHRHGVVHRDVKPANIMVLADGRVKIMDFGIARLTGNRDATRLTQQGSVIGTLLYMAPEQFAGGEVDALCDIFAYGVVYYEFLTGRHPFEAPDARSLMYKISFEEPPPIRDFVPECPDALQRAVSRLLHKDREFRYQSLKELQLDTEPIRIEFQQLRAGSLLQQAQDLYRARKVEQAQALVLEVLDLDPANRQARSLWESLQKQVQLRTLQPRIEGLARAAEDHLAQRRFAEAVQSFEAALRLDRENTQLQTRRDQAQAQFESARRAAALVADGRKKLDLEDLTAAHHIAAEALRQDPQNPDAARLAETVETAIARREKERQVRDAIAGAETLLMMNAYADAAAALEALGDASGSPEVQGVLERIEREKVQHERRLRLDREMAAATAMLREQRYEDAVGALERLRADFPESQEVSRLYSHARKELDGQRRSRALAGIARQVGALEQAHDFDAALAVLDEALKTHPGEGMLIQLLGGTLSAKADWDRRQAIQAAQAQCEALRAEGRFAEAIQNLEAALRDYGAVPELGELLQRLEREWEEQRRREAILKATDAARALLGQDRADDAVDVLRRALRDYPGDAILSELLNEAAARAVALRRAREVEATLREADAHINAREFDRALGALARGLRGWPGDETLTARQQAVQEQKAAWERQCAIEEAVRHGQQLGSQGEFTQALETVRSALGQFEDEPALLDLQDQLQHALAAHERREAMRRGTEGIRQLLDANRLDEAREAARDLAKSYTGEREISEMAAEIEGRIEARERALAIAKIAEQAEAHVAARQFDRALKLISEGLRNYPGDSTLTRELEAARAAKAAWEREQAIAETLRRAGQLAGAHKYSEAVSLVSKALQQYEDEPLLADAQRQLEEEWWAYKRQQEIAEAMAQARTLLDRGRVEQAAQFLRGARARYPGVQQFEDLLAWADAELRRQAKAAAIAKARQDAEGLAARGEFDAALAAIADALKDWPDEAELLALHEEIGKQKAAREYQDAVAEFARQADNMSRQGRFEDALAFLDESLQSCADDPTLLALRQRIDAEWEKHKRSEAIGKAASQARALLEQGRLEEALEVARSSTGRYPGEAVLESLASRAARELEERRLRTRALQEGAELLEAGQLADAVRSLQSAVARFPADEELNNLLARASELLEAQGRAEAIGRLAHQARSLANGRNFDGALTLLDRGLRSWPGERALLDLQEAIRGEKTAWRREQDLRERLRSIGKLARENRFAEGLAAVEAALAEYPEESELTGLRQRLSRGKGLEDAAHLLAQGDPAGALELLQQLAARHPGDAEIENLVGRSREEIAHRERAEAIARLLDSARAVAAERDYNWALSMLEDGLRTWPDDPGLRELRQSIANEQAAWEHRQELRDELAEIDRAGTGAPSVADANRLLERARAIEGETGNDEELRGAAQGVVKHLSDAGSVARQLEKGQWPGALELAREYLARYPNHVLFNQFAARAEAGLERQELDEIRLAAEKEENLETREQIWQDALKRFPQEASVADALKRVQDTLNRAGAIGEEARAFEAEGRWEDALARWRELQELHRHYPAVETSIARVERAREQARSQAVAAWSRAIGQEIDAGNLEKAARSVERALAEFPDEPSLLDAAHRLEAVRDAAKRAKELLAEGRRSCESGDYDAGRTRLHQAFSLEHGDDALRTQILSSFTEYSRTAIFRGDLHNAETLVREAKALDAGYAAPADLMKAIAGAKQAEMVQACLTREAQLRDAGDFRTALGEVEHLLGTYPENMQLRETRVVLLTRIGEQRDKVTRELQQIREAGQATEDPAQLEHLRRRATTIAAEQHSDAELRSAADTVASGLAAHAGALRRARLLAPFANPRYWIAGLGTAGLAIAAIVGIPKLIQSRHEIQVDVTSQTAGATVTAGGKSCTVPCSLDLRPGRYTLTASKEGFNSLAQPLVIAANSAGISVPLAFTPLPETLQVNTNFEGGTVFLDGRRAGELHDGQFTAQGVASGRHTLRITGGGAEFEAQWQSAPGAVPQLASRIVAKDLDAALVSSLAGKGVIACNCGAQDVYIDSTRGGRTNDSAGVPLSGLSPGTHQLGIAQRSMVLDVRTNPTLTVFLALDRNVGMLVVETGQDNARIYLNNKLYQRTTEHGLIRIPVPVGQHTIRVEKEGFRGQPAQSVEVAKSEEKRVLLPLVPAPAVLQIAGAQPGAQVRLDGRVLGETDAAGGFQTEVAAGDHAIELTKDGYGPVRLTLPFSAGKTLRPAAPQVAMAKVVKAPDPAQVEAQDWERVASSDSIDQLEDFVRRHPGGAHVSEARARQAQLRQEAQAAATRQAEQTAWNAIDKSRRASLEDFLTRYPNSTHAQEARAAIAAIVKQETDALAAAQRAKDAKDQDDKERDVAARRVADEQAVGKALTDFEAAYNRKDMAALEALWSPMPGNTAALMRDQFRLARTITFQLRPVGRPAMAGDSATIDCTRTLNLITRDGGHPPAVAERVRVTLGRTRTGWVIQSIARY